MITITMPDGGPHEAKERKRFDRTSVTEAIITAATVARERDSVHYVYPTAYGFMVERSMPGWLKGYAVYPDGLVTLVGAWAQ